MLSRSVVLCFWKVLRTVHDDVKLMLDGEHLEVGVVEGLGWR